LILTRILLCEANFKNKMKRLSKIKIEKNYAQALLKAALNENVLDKVQKDMHALKSVRDVERIDSPLIERERQTALIDMLQKKLWLQKTTVQFLHVLDENNSLNRFMGIATQFDDMILARQNVEKVVVETAQPLTERQEEKLIRGLKRNLKKDVVISYVLNDNILGGLILRIGSFEIDDSLKNKLKTLENMMKGLS